MKLINIGLFIFSIGVSLLLLHCCLELLSIFKIKRWLKKNKEVLLKDEYILNKYNDMVLNSDEYKQLKELYDENLFLIKSFAKVGLNYTDFLFFQGLMDDYQKKATSMSDINNVYNKVKKLIWIMFSFEVSLFAKKTGRYMVKLSLVYFVVLFIYKKFF